MLIIFKILIFFVIGFIVAEILYIVISPDRKRRYFLDKYISLHMHHSILGLFLIILAGLMPDYSVELISLGVGVLVQHTKKEGFIFIQKWQDHDKQQKIG